MARYINAEKLAEAICKFPAIDEHSANAVISLLQKQPTADVVEVKHGEWIIDNSQVERTFYEYNYKILITCNICGNRHFLGTQQYRNFTQEDLKEDTYRKYRYCGQCGAKMDRGKAE